MLNFMMLLLIIVCVFDPAGKILNIKYPLFIINIFLFLVKSFFNSYRPKFNRRLVVYILVFFVYSNVVNLAVFHF